MPSTKEITLVRKEANTLESLRRTGEKLAADVRKNAEDQKAQAELVDKLKKSLGVSDSDLSSPRASQTPVAATAAIKQGGGRVVSNSPPAKSD